MSANDYQVGGTHYKSAYGHWDWVTNIGMHYLAGCCTKYIIRWRNKDGLKDIEKAIHYSNKLIEVSAIIAPQRVGLNHNWISVENRRFFDANNMSGLEREICTFLANWTSRQELIEAGFILSTLYNENSPLTIPEGR